MVDNIPMPSQTIFILDWDVNDSLCSKVEGIEAGAAAVFIGNFSYYN